MALMQHAVSLRSVHHLILDQESTYRTRSHEHKLKLIWTLHCRKIFISLDGKSIWRKLPAVYASLSSPPPFLWADMVWCGCWCVRCVLAEKTSEIYFSHVRHKGEWFCSITFASQFSHRRRRCPCPYIFHFCNIFSLASVSCSMRSLFHWLLLVDFTSP